MKPVAIIGLDIAKTVFQVHGVNAAGQVVVRQRLTRGRVLAFFEKLTPCLVGIEACGNSHYWARELIARGHEVRLMPAQHRRHRVRFPEFVVAVRRRLKKRQNGARCFDEFRRVVHIRSESAFISFKSAETAARSDRSV
jgi:transposase